MTLTLSTMIAGTAIAPFFPEAILSPVLVFLAASLSAFCASNWASSREYHKTRIPKEGAESPAVKQLIAENKKLLKKLDEAMDSGDTEEVARVAMENMQEMTNTVLTVGQTAGATLQAVQQLNQKVTNLMQLKGQ